MMDRAPKPNNIDMIPVGVKREIARMFQIGKEGISHDYKNEYESLAKWCKSLLNMPGFEKETLGWTDEELRRRIWEKLKTFRSYTNYANAQTSINGVGVGDFLTKRGITIVKKIDKISTQIQRFTKGNPEEVDVRKLLDLLDEIKTLMVSN